MEAEHDHRCDWKGLKKKNNYLNFTINSEANLSMRLVQANICLAEFVLTVPNTWVTMGSEACATEESLRPRERSRQLDEALRFQRLQKTVSIPVPPQHCVLVHTGTTGFFCFFSWTVLKLPPVDEPTDWHFCCVWILCSSSPRFLKSAVFVTFSTGNSVSPPEVSAPICALR